MLHLCVIAKQRKDSQLRYYIVSKLYTTIKSIRLGYKRKFGACGGVVLQMSTSAPSVAKFQIFGNVQPTN